MIGNSTHSHDPDWLLTVNAYREMTHALGRQLPLPEQDTPDYLDRRNRAAVAKVAALHPVNAIEVDYAVEAVSCKAHQADCLRLAVLAGDNIKQAMWCRAQAGVMSRQADRSMRTLLKLQAERRTREATQALADNDAWVARGVVDLMTDGSRDEMDPVQQPDTSGQAAQTPIEPSQPLAPEPPDPLGAAEELAIVNPSWAALIRRQGGVPQGFDLDAPTADVVQALVAGCTPVLAALDRMRAG